MFRRKFIDRLKDKYQFGGPRGGLRNPYLTLQGRNINTPEGQRFGAGAKLSAPLLESLNYGKSATGLRFETDFAGTNSGPISISNNPKAYNASIGLRGYHNRYANKNKNLVLNTDIGVGIGTGDSQTGEMKPYGDTNLSLLKSKITNKGRTLSGGPTLSYGTESSPTPGLRAGLKGSYGRLSGNLGYDITNKMPRAGISLNFQEGGVRHQTGGFDLSEATVTGGGPGGEELKQRYKSPAWMQHMTPQENLIKSAKNLPNIGTKWRDMSGREQFDLGQRFKGMQMGTIGDRIEKYGPTWEDYEEVSSRRGQFPGGPLDPKYLQQQQFYYPDIDIRTGEIRSGDQDTPSNPNYKGKEKQTGGMYDQIQQYQTGGSNVFNQNKIKLKTETNPYSGEVETRNLGYDSDIDDMRMAKTVLSLSDELAEHQGSRSGVYGSGSIADLLGYAKKEAAFTKRGIYENKYDVGEYGRIGGRTDYSIAREINQSQPLSLVRPINVTVEEAGKNLKFKQTGGMYDQIQQYQGGGRKLQERIAKSFSGSNIPARINMQLLNEALANKYLDDRISGSKYLDDRISKGNYETIKKQTGGTRLPGGVVEPIPGSDAVEFRGNDHDEGGIMMDPQTEVEDGETMDQVTMAQKGGKRDYFFSSHLKKGGRSYADMHKNILENGGSQEEINMLARMQEAAAGRNPRQVAKLGGVVKYQTGGEDQDELNYVDVPAPAANNPYAASSREELEKKQNQQRNYVYTTSDETKGYNEYLKDLKSSPSPDPNNPDAGILTFGEWSEMQKQVHSGPTETIDYAALDRAALEELKNKARKKGAKGRGVPTEAYVGMGAQMLPSIYAFLHKQKKPEQIGYTPGFTSPIVASRVKSQDLDRVNYNDKRSNLTSSIRGMNKFIETSGGGPANIANMQATLAKEIDGQMKIDATETQANIAIDNREKEMRQQTAFDNVRRSQAASTMNAQLARAEAARADEVEALNVTAKNKFQSDQELNRMNALISSAQGIAGGAGDILTYKSGERMAQAIGTEGIYKRDVIRDFIKKRAAKDGIPGVCAAGDCTEKQINAVVANV